VKEEESAVVNEKKAKDIEKLLDVIKTGVKKDTTEKKDKTTTLSA
jgi:hypothetical protein